MSRSPLAYPLTRSVDGDAGGAADLQTDIMRFMAILALCLVAIFALVQSIPLAPKPVPVEPLVIEQPPVVEPVAVEEPPTPAEPEPDRTEMVQLTRPQWQPPPRPAAQTQLVREPAAAPPVAVPEPTPAPAEATPPPAEPVGFTLRFESDLALTRLVASNQVGFYAIANGRSQRMAVSNSRISFWDASTPNSFHEMEAATVPAPVIEALARTGVSSNSVDWGVTLPGALSRQLDSVMRDNDGGSLVIGIDGQLRLEGQ